MFKNAAIGTVDALGQATAYSIKALFSFIRENPKLAAGISVAVIMDQFLFNNNLMKGIPLIGGGVITNFIGFIFGQFSKAGEAVGVSAALAVFDSIKLPLAILAAAGIGIYGAYRLIRVLFYLGEAKAMQIAKRLETASEDEKEEILRKELKVNTRRLKKQRA